MTKQSISDAVGQASGQSRKKELDSLMSEVGKKAESVNKSSQPNSINDEEIKRKLLGSLFEVLQAAGVDPNDLGSISAFLRELEAQSPDLYELFQYAFNALTGSTPPSANTENAGLMGKYSNLGPQTMMPPQGMLGGMPEAGPMPGGMPQAGPMPGGMPQGMPEAGPQMAPPPASPVGPQMPI